MAVATFLSCSKNNNSWLQVCPSSTFLQQVHIVILLLMYINSTSHLKKNWHSFISHGKQSNIPKSNRSNHFSFSSLGFLLQLICEWALYDKWLTHICLEQRSKINMVMIYFLPKKPCQKMPIYCLSNSWKNPISRYCSFLLTENTINIQCQTSNAKSRNNWRMFLATVRDIQPHTCLPLYTHHSHGSTMKHKCYLYLVKKKQYN